MNLHTIRPTNISQKYAHSKDPGELLQKNLQKENSDFFSKKNSTSKLSTKSKSFRIERVKKRLGLICYVSQGDHRKCAHNLQNKITCDNQGSKYQKSHVIIFCKKTRTLPCKFHS